MEGCRFEVYRRPISRTELEVDSKWRKNVGGRRSGRPRLNNWPQNHRKRIKRRIRPCSCNLRKKYCTSLSTGGRRHEQLHGYWIQMRLLQFIPVTLQHSGRTTSNSEQFTQSGNHFLALFTYINSST